MAGPFEQYSAQPLCYIKLGELDLGLIQRNQVVWLEQLPPKDFEPVQPHIPVSGYDSSESLTWETKETTNVSYKPGVNKKNLVQVLVEISVEGEYKYYGSTSGDWCPRGSYSKKHLFIKKTRAGNIRSALVGMENYPPKKN